MELLGVNQEAEIAENWQKKWKCKYSRNVRMFVRKDITVEISVLLIADAE